MYSSGIRDGAAKYISNHELSALLCTSDQHLQVANKPSAPSADSLNDNCTMVCLSFSSSGCQDGHPTALDYVLAVLIMFTAVVAARLLASAVARCLCGDGHGHGHGPDAHHHHHHHDHHHPSPDATDDVDELPWGGSGLAIFGQPGIGVPPLPPPPRRNDQGWHCHGMLAPPVAASSTTERVGHVAQPSSP